MIKKIFKFILNIIQALTLKDDPKVSLAFPPVGLHKIVLHLHSNNNTLHIILRFKHG